MPVLSESGVLVPAYGEQPAKVGLYLALLHGRRSPRSKLSDWGFDGPLIGPLSWFHTIYATDIRIEFESSCDEERFFIEPIHPDPHELASIDGLVEYGGNFFGDWTVLYIDEDSPGTYRDSLEMARRKRSVPNVRRSGTASRTPNLRKLTSRPARSNLPMAMQEIYFELRILQVDSYEQFWEYELMSKYFRRIEDLLVTLQSLLDKISSELRARTRLPNIHFREEDFIVCCLPTRTTCRVAIVHGVAFLVDAMGGFLDHPEDLLRVNQTGEFWRQQRNHPIRQLSS